MEQEEKPRRLWVYVLATILLISVMATGLIYRDLQLKQQEAAAWEQSWEKLTKKLEKASLQVAIAPISLNFTAIDPVKRVPGTGFTYLMGYVTVSRLTRIVARPIILHVGFSVNVEAPDYGNITYSYTESQELEIAPPEFDTIQIPWGAFPIEMKNFTSGDVILWNMEVTVSVEWLGYMVATQRTSALYTLEVV